MTRSTRLTEQAHEPITSILAALHRPAALVVLEDGRTFGDQAYEAIGSTAGEAVFNTAMTAYQETLTDPSYHRQVAIVTAPHIGNPGRPAAESSIVWSAKSSRHGFRRCAGNLGRLSEGAGHDRSQGRLPGSGRDSGRDLGGTRTPAAGSGYHEGGLPKLTCAKAIAMHMNVEKNNSVSFCHFRDGVRRLVGKAA